MIIKILTSIALACFGLESFQSTHRFISDPGGQCYNRDFVESSSYPIIFTLVALYLGRVLLLVAALKYERLLNVCFYYETLI